MDWYGQSAWGKGSGDSRLDIDLVTPWDVSFTPPQAFKTSVSTESTSKSVHSCENTVGALVEDYSTVSEYSGPLIDLKYSVLYC